MGPKKTPTEQPQATTTAQKTTPSVKKQRAKKEGEKKLYRSGLSEDQLTFIENDLNLVPQDRMVVAMMHIPLVKSTPWLAPRRERLLKLLESREHCISLAGHTHHHEHLFYRRGG